MKRIVHAILFPLVMLTTCSVADVYEKAPDTQTSQMAKTDPAIAVFMVPGEDGSTMGSMHVKVPHISGGTVLLCFKYPSAQHMDCFYRNDENGHVIVKPVMSNMATT